MQGEASSSSDVLHTYSFASSEAKQRVYVRDIPTRIYNSLSAISDRSYISVMSVLHIISLINSLGFHTNLEEQMLLIVSSNIFNLRR